MSKDKDKIAGLEEALKQTHQRKAPPEPSAWFSGRVQQSIAEQSESVGLIDELTRALRHIWLAAGCATSVAVALILYQQLANGSKVDSIMLATTEFDFYTLFLL